MKLELLTFGLLGCFLLHGQVENAKEFVDFAMLEPEEKHLRLGTENGWVGLGAEQYVEDNEIVSDLDYWRYYNSEKYFLTLKTRMNTTSGESTYVTKVVVGKEAIFKEWMKQLENEGLRFVKSPDGSEKWITPDELFFVVLMEKRKIKDIWVYEISIITF